MQVRNYHKLNHISPLIASNNLKAKSFGVVDIETMDYNGFQIPVAISIAADNTSKLFIINNFIFFLLFIKNFNFNFKFMKIKIKKK